MRKTITAAALAVAVLVPMIGRAQEVTANAGWLSQYYYRGILQNTSSASAGLTVTGGGLTAGTWAADVGDGSEVDLFGSYGRSVGGLSLSAGGTGYFYTGQFDHTYLEGNLGAGFGPVSAALAIGQYDDSHYDDAVGYLFMSVTATSDKGCFATFGMFGGDDEFYAKDGKYVQAGYGFSAADLDFSISGIWNSSELSDALDDAGKPTHELTWVFGVSKTFALLP